MTPKSLLHPARLARRPVLATQSDSRLVDLVRAGYEPAFEAVVERYRRPLLRYVGQIVPPERCEDVVQLAFVNAYEAMRRDARELDLKPWLYRIAHNAALNSLRDRALHHTELREDFDGVEPPDQALERSEGLRDLLAAVGSLPARQRDAIVLRELEGRSYGEIAGALGVSDGAVRQLLNRARNTLRAVATAVVPVGLVSRLPWTATAEPVHARAAEALGAAGAGALAAKVCATALVTGAVVGGVALAPRDARDAGRDAEAAERVKQPDGAGRAGGAAGGPRADDPDGTVGSPGDDRDGRRAGRDDTDERRGEDDRDDDGSSSGPGGGDDREDEAEDDGPDGDGSGEGGLSSGPGSGEDQLLSSGGGGSSSGSGSGSSGSGSSFDDSGSGSESSRSGFDNSGSDSESSGSSSQGSGSSGDGTPDELEPID